MERRKFISLLGGAAAAWPVGARGQQTERLSRIGVLMNLEESDSEGQTRVIAFREALQKLGWTEGRDVRIDYRWGSSNPERLRTFAIELVQLKPDVIFGTGAPALAALQRATQSIPIVFTQVADPVGGGFVPSLARPGGNITGFTNHEYTMVGKWLQSLREIAPSVDRVAIVQNPTNPSSAGYLREIMFAASLLRVTATPADILDAVDVERVISAFTSAPNGGLIVLSDPTTNVHRHLIIGLAARYRVPAIFLFRYYVAAGGLMSYGADVVDLYRRSALYVDRILKGAKPADLPVQAPTKFELVINLNTAKALGLDVPAILLARADEVIE